MEPISNPIITHLLAKEWWEKAQTPKPTALGTPLRYSSAYACARQQSYAAFEAKVTEPVDEAGAWVMGVGTLIHEALQEAIGRQFPNAEFEVGTAHGDYLSGSCDAYIPSADLAGIGNVLYELKTMGTYSFDKQVGWNRMRATLGDAQGPALKAIAQAGMNALGIEKDRGIEIEYVVLGSLALEALSKQKAATMGISEPSRFSGEWWLTRDQWEPIAISELNRVERIAADVENGYIGERSARDDNGRDIWLDPLGSAWQCAYCAYRTTCVADGPGAPSVTESVINIKSKEQDNG